MFPAALEAVYDDIDFSGPRPKPLSFDGWKPPREELDPLAHLAPGEHHVAAILERHSGRRTETKAAADSFGADTIPDRSPVVAPDQFSKRAPSSKVTYKKLPSGASSTADFSQESLETGFWRCSARHAISRKSSGAADSATKKCSARSEFLPPMKKLSAAQQPWGVRKCEEKMEGYAAAIEAAGAKLLAITNEHGKVVVTFRRDDAPVRAYASAVRSVEDVELALKAGREQECAACWELTV